MRKLLIGLSIFVFAIYSFIKLREKQETQKISSKNLIYSLEDTVRYQIGGKLYNLNFFPSDSITVINSSYYQSKDGDLYRYYHFIVHNRYSNAHYNFTYSTLDSIYNSYTTNEWYQSYFESYYKPMLNSKQTIQIDSSVKKFNGYWVYLKEYDGDYYLEDSWSWHASFCIADSIFTNHYMDGPDHKKILELIPIDPNSISISFGGEPKRIEIIDDTRQVYKLINGRHIYFICPARAIHNFEIIQYTNNTGELM